MPNPGVSRGPLAATFQAMPDGAPLVDRDEIARLRERFAAALVPVAGSQEPPALLESAWPDPGNLPGLLAVLDDLKACLDSFRPLNTAQSANLAETFETEYTYDSNRIEGNTLTLQETAVVLRQGITVGGKTLREHLEAANHHAALAEAKALAAGGAPFTEDALRALHATVLRGIDQPMAGVYRPHGCMIVGSRHVPPASHLVPRLMRECFEWFREAEGKEHPVVLAAGMKERIVTVHPFSDGNGRVSRLVMNLLLMRAGYPVTTIASDRARRAAYYAALEAAQIGEDSGAFQFFAAQAVRRSLLRYLAAVWDAGSGEGQGSGSRFFAALRDRTRQIFP